MNVIVKANEKDVQLLAEIGKRTFIESHGNSASAEDINSYVDLTYTNDVFKKELSDPKNIYHIIYHDDKAAGYSKIILNNPGLHVSIQNITKLERLYVLREFYGSGCGAELFTFNVELSRQNGQSGMWLFAWKENERAVKFYKKNGFNIIGSYDYKISETHSNPNHQMLLEY